jgi:hypothetical protein
MKINPGRIALRNSREPATKAKPPLSREFASAANKTAMAAESHRGHKYDEKPDFKGVQDIERLAEVGAVGKDGQENDTQNGEFEGGENVFAGEFAGEHMQLDLQGEEQGGDHAQGSRQCQPIMERENATSEATSVVNPRIPSLVSTKNMAVKKAPSTARHAASGRADPAISEIWAAKHPQRPIKPKVRTPADCSGPSGLVANSRCIPISIPIASEMPYFRKRSGSVMRFGASGL